MFLYYYKKIINNNDLSHDLYINNFFFKSNISQKLLSSINVVSLERDFLTVNDFSFLKNNDFFFLPNKEFHYLYTNDLLENKALSVKRRGVRYSNYMYYYYMKI